MLLRSGANEVLCDRFKQLNEVDRTLALKTFEKNQDFYHPICKAQVARDLGIGK